MRNEIEGAKTRQTKHLAPRYGTAVSSIAGTYQIIDGGPSIYLLAPIGASRDVYLPPISYTGGQDFVVKNTSGSFNLNVRDADGALIETLATGALDRFMSTRTGWMVFSAAASGSGAPSDADYLVRTANAGLSAERVVGDNAAAGGINFDWTVPGAVKAILNTPTALLPTGGSTNQVLAKASNANYDVAWTTSSGGGVPEAPVDTKFYARKDATWADIALNFAPLASPALTGNPTAPTAAANDNDTSIATTAFVQGIFSLPHSWSKNQAPVAGSITSAVAADFSTFQLWFATVSGATFTVANPSTAPLANTHIEILLVFSTANTVAFGTKYKGLAGYIPSASAGARDIIWFFYDLGTDQYYMVGSRTGINL